MEIKDLYKDRNLLQLFINNARKQTDVKIIELAQILGISKKYSFKLYNRDRWYKFFNVEKRTVPNSNVEKGTVPNSSSKFQEN